MQITDIKIRQLNTSGKLKAIVSVTFDNAFAVHDIKVIARANKTFVAMPSRRTPDGEFKDIVHPINQDMRIYLENAVIRKYKETLLGISIRKCSDDGCKDECPYHDDSRCCVDCQDKEKCHAICCDLEDGKCLSSCMIENT